MAVILFESSKFYEQYDRHGWIGNPAGKPCGVYQCHGKRGI